MNDAHLAAVKTDVRRMLHDYGYPEDDALVESVAQVVIDHEDD